MEKVSIIVPVYNASKSISRCIESVLKQTYKEWELILIDDGSKDDSGKICDDYATGDERVLAIHISNGGVSNARNVGIDKASGSWIAFLDADDYLGPHFLNDLLVYRDYDTIWGGYVSIPSHAKYFRHNNSFEGKELCQFLTLFNGNGYPWGKLFRTSIVKKAKIRFDVNLRVYEDMLFCFQYLQYANSIKLIPNCNYYYLDPPTKIICEKFVLSEDEIIFLHETLQNQLDTISQKYSFDKITLKLKLIGHYSICRVMLEESDDNYLKLAERLYGIEQEEVYSNQQISPINAFWNLIKATCLEDNQQKTERFVASFVKFYEAYGKYAHMNRVDSLALSFFKKGNVRFATYILVFRYKYISHVISLIRKIVC